jgi:hypothetical protein
MNQDRAIYVLRNPMGLKQERRHSRWWAAKYIEDSTVLLQGLIDEGHDPDGRIQEFLDQSQGEVIARGGVII